MKKRKDGRYALQKTIAGKRIAFYGKTPAEVYKKIEEYKKNAGKPPTFNELADRWVSDKWDDYSIGTQNCYRSALERAREEFGDSVAADVTPHDVQILIDRMAEQGYSSKSVKTEKCVVSIIYRHALIEGTYRGNNPATPAIIRRGLPKTRREPPSEDAIKKIMQYDDWLLPKLLLFTGLRRGEALALCYEDIDRQKKIIHVNKQVVYRGNQPCLVDRTKTPSGVRDVIIPDALMSIIPDGSGPMFNTTLKRFKARWASFCVAIDEYVTPHQLRHAYATILHDADVGLKDAQYLLGHSTIQMTQDIYTHIDNRRKAATVDKINSFFGANIGANEVTR